jgi:hypothetical protein
MVPKPVTANRGWQLRLTRAAHDRILAHTLRPGDPVAFCTIGIDTRRRRILVRDVFPVGEDDLTPTEMQGHRSVPSRVVARYARRAADAELGLLWIHAHPGSGDCVEPSGQDDRTSGTANPVIATITGRPSAALVVSETNAVGTVWLTDGTTAPIESVVVVGANIRELAPRAASPAPVAGRYARQVLLFGNIGQQLLRGRTVAIIGAGGGGSLLNMLVGHLGVGKIICIDFDRVSASNLSRIVESTPWDVLRRRRKVDVAARYTSRTSPRTPTTRLVGDVTYTTDAELILDADYIFLATDTAFARYAFNAICHQYLIPGSQIGAKITTRNDGAIDLIYTAVRHLHFQDGCMLCARVIPLDVLHDEQLTDDQRRQQRYADTPEGDQLEDPSVISLNAITAAHAVNTMMMSMCCLLDDGLTLAQDIHYPAENRTRQRPMKAQPGCHVCDRTTPSSTFARGDVWPLPLRQRPSPGLKALRSPAGLGRAIAPFRRVADRWVARRNRRSRYLTST